MGVGESPSFMPLNFRMTEVTGAVGLAQLQRIDDYLAEYTQNLHTMNAAIQGCQWLRARHVPTDAFQTGYIWACTWAGDQHNLELDRFKQTTKDWALTCALGFIGKPAYQFDLFQRFNRLQPCRLPDPLPALYQHQ